MNLFTKIESVLGMLRNGWCTVQKAQTLASTILAIRPRVVVEIGTYAGRSFIPMALALRELGHGMAVGIDPYCAQVSVKNEDEANAAWWESLDHGKIEEEFLGWIDELELRPFTRVIKKRSDEVDPEAECGEIGLLHVDGSHTEQAFRDVERFAPLVEPGGFVFLDDISWASGEVSRSMVLLEDMGFVRRRRVIGQEPEQAGLMPMANDWASFQRLLGMRKTEMPRD